MFWVWFWDWVWFCFCFCGLFCESPLIGGPWLDGLVFGGLPRFPFGSCFDSRLSYFGWSWLADAGSSVGNDGNLPGFFFGEAPALCFAFALLSGVRSFLWSVLCSDVFVFFVRFSACFVLDSSFLS